MWFLASNLGTSHGQPQSTPGEGCAAPASQSGGTVTLLAHSWQQEPSPGPGGSPEGPGLSSPCRQRALSLPHQAFWVHGTSCFHLLASHCTSSLRSPVPAGFGLCNSMKKHTKSVTTGTGTALRGALVTGGQPGWSLGKRGWTGHGHPAPNPPGKGERRARAQSAAASASWSRK